MVKKPFIFSFYIPIQNLCKIFSWSLKQSCRELNSKQLLFLGHFQKISFTCSKIDLKLLFENYLKIEIEKTFFSPSQAAASHSACFAKPARPNYVPARAAPSFSRARTRTSRPRAGYGRPVAAMRRRR
jgi:hypothetical protein